LIGKRDIVAPNVELPLYQAEHAAVHSTSMNANPHVQFRNSSHLPNQSKEELKNYYKRCFSPTLRYSFTVVTRGFRFTTEGSFCGPKHQTAARKRANGMFCFGRQQLKLRHKYIKRKAADQVSPLSQNNMGLHWKIYIFT